MSHDLRYFAAESSGSSGQVDVIIAAEDMLVEYVILQICELPEEIRIVSRGIYRVLPDSDQDAVMLSLDTALIAGALLESILDRDRWACMHLATTTHFIEIDDGGERLTDIVKHARSQAARRQFRAAVEPMRGLARTLDVKRFLDHLLTQIELTTRPSLHASSCIKEEITASATGR